MTEQAIYELMESAGYPMAYHHFDEEPEPPYVVCQYPGSHNMSADNRVYQRFQKLQVKLYTSQKDWEAEAKVEAMLEEAGFCWQKAETWIETKNLYEIMYEMEVMIHE